MKQLADQICPLLGIAQIGCEVERFRDGEMVGRVLGSVAGMQVILVHSCEPPANDSVLELLLLADACTRGGALSVTAVVPYLAYTRGDKRNGRTESIAARMIVDFMAVVGIGELICIDPHFPQFEGFCSMKSTVLSAVPLLCRAIEKELIPEAVIVAPDGGSLRSARLYGQLLGLPVLALDKNASNSEVPARFHATKLFIVIDDMISTGASLASITEKLRSSNNIAQIWASAVHGLLLNSAEERLSANGVTRLFLTDSLDQATRRSALVRVVSIAGLVADTLLPRL